MADAAPASPPAGEAARDTVWRLIVSTVSACLRNRVTGLAAEAAFFALLSLPPLIFGLAGSIGYIVQRFTDQRVGEFKADVVDLASQAFTDDTVQKIIVPTMNDVLGGPRYDVISIGFILALWSGSRALNVFVDTVTIMYGLGGHRGIVRTRVLSFSLYVLGLLTGILTIPLVVAGPALVDKALPRTARRAQRALLAARRRDVHLLHRDALPRVGAGADVVALQPPRRRAHHGDLDRRLRGPALVPDRDVVGLDVDLRAAGGARSRS